MGGGKGKSGGKGNAQSRQPGKAPGPGRDSGAGFGQLEAEMLAELAALRAEAKAKSDSEPAASRELSVEEKMRAIYAQSASYKNTPVYMGPGKQQAGNFGGADLTPRAAPQASMTNPATIRASQYEQRGGFASMAEPGTVVGPGYPRAGPSGCCGTAQQPGGGSDRLAPSENTANSGGMAGNGGPLPGVSGVGGSHPNFVFFSSDSGLKLHKDGLHQGGPASGSPAPSGSVPGCSLPYSSIFGDGSCLRPCDGDSLQGGSVRSVPGASRTGGSPSGSGSSLGYHYGDFLPGSHVPGDPFLQDPSLRDSLLGGSVPGGSVPSGSVPSGSLTGSTLKGSGLTDGISGLGVRDPNEGVAAPFGPLDRIEALQRATRRLHMATTSDKDLKDLAIEGWRYDLNRAAEGEGIESANRKYERFKKALGRDKPGPAALAPGGRLDVLRPAPVIIPQARPNAEAKGPSRLSDEIPDTMTGEDVDSEEE